MNQATKVKDTLNQIININYTALGKISSVNLKVNKGSRTSITLYTKTYDEVGHKTSKADSSGEAAAYSYNRLGLMT